MLTRIPINNRTLKVGWNEVLVDVNSYGAHNTCVGSPCKGGIMQTIFTNWASEVCSVIVTDHLGQYGGLFWSSMETDSKYYTHQHILGKELKTDSREIITRNIITILHTFGDHDAIYSSDILVNLYFCVASSGKV